MKNNLLTICLLLLITSCDSGPSLTKICQLDKELCQVFTEDSWCKLERKNVIIGSSLAKKTQEDIQKFNLLLNLEDYSKCLNHAKKIEHIKLKSKKSLRIENFLKSKQLIKEVSEDTKNSTHPSLLFYHWSRYTNKEALNSLLLMEGSAALDTPEAQFNLASYYVKRDKYKTLSLLFHALELYKKDEVINVEIFSSLVTIFQNSERAKQAYIWLKVLHLYQPNNENTTEETLIDFAKVNHLKSKFLDKVAYQTLDNIKSGTFKTPTF
jgi:hypothetical protein|tara:strand:- start:154 stop:954 length:801 start_codon:yes stop_codon:yes gene_type:complete